MQVFLIDHFVIFLKNDKHDLDFQFKKILNLFSKKIIVMLICRINIGRKNGKNLAPYLYGAKPPKGVKDEKTSKPPKGVLISETLKTSKYLVKLKF